LKTQCIYFFGCFLSAGCILTVFYLIYKLVLRKNIVMVLEILIITIQQRILASTAKSYGIRATSDDFGRATNFLFDFWFLSE